jgi:hypothetical protein
MVRNGTKETVTKWKIPPTRIKSDDCMVYVGRVIEDGEIKNQGTGYKVHEDEWVEMLPCTTLGEIMALSELGGMAGSGPASLRALCLHLSQRIIGWNWTGLDTEALPQPYKSPEVLEQITDDELMWLMSAAQGKETEGDRKNA